LLATPDDANFVREALCAGARGVLAKSARVKDLVKAVRIVYEGQIWAPRQVLSNWLEELLGVTAFHATLDQRLSWREREICQCAATGLANKEVADRLTISEATVKAHLTHIFRKLGIRRRSQLAAAYYGMISLRLNEGGSPWPAARHPSLSKGNHSSVTASKPIVLRRKA
jgi:DNA-binding NarL/FixJ family response regulator